MKSPHWMANLILVMTLVLANTHGPGPSEPPCYTCRDHAATVCSHSNGAQWVQRNRRMR
jgi:hypothetical protein